MTETLKNTTCWSAWLARSVEHTTLDLGVMSLSPEPQTPSPRLGVEFTFKGGSLLFKGEGRGLTQSGQHGTLDLWVMSSSPVLGEELTLKTKQNKKKEKNHVIYTKHFAGLGLCKWHLEGSESNCYLRVRGQNSKN